MRPIDLLGWGFRFAADFWLLVYVVIIALSPLLFAVGVAWLLWSCQ